MQRSPNLRFRIGVCACLALAAGAAAQDTLTQPPSSPPEQAAAEKSPAVPYLRIAEGDDAISLEVASRRFVPADGEGPEVHLTGAVHIADQAFYDAVQAFLDEQDVVLFEAVKPSAAPRTGEQLTDDAKAKATRLGLARLSTLIARHRSLQGELPESLDALLASLSPGMKEIGEASVRDAWDRPVEYRVLPAPDDAAQPGYEVLSLGADGEPGGKGAAEDITRTVEPGARAPRPEGPSIQQELASALGLVFQMSGVNYNRPHWRNSDMSMDEMQKRLEESGADPEALLGMLEGNSFSARFASIILGFIRGNPTWQAGGKIMLIELLGRAEQLESLMAARLGPMVEVIIKDRNAVVINDLRAIIESEPEVRTVGIFYGAGHLPDLERRLVEELRYKPAEDRWFPAITVDPGDSGLDAASIQMMRSMVGSSIDAQIKREQRRSEQRKPGTR